MNALPVLFDQKRVKKHELATVIAACLLNFCVFVGYFSVRPVREAVGAELGSDLVSKLFIVTWIASVAIIPAYGLLCARFTRKAFLPWMYGFVALCLGVCGLIFRQDEQNLFAGSFFYVLISILNLFIISVFWSFLLEMFSFDQTKRLFGIIAAGGSAGAIVGPLFSGYFVEAIANSGILFVGAAMFVIAIFFQQLLHRICERSLSGDEARITRSEEPIGGNPFAGFWLVLNSPYLLGSALFVVLLASVNTFLYFQQLDIVRDTFQSSAERTRVFSQLDVVVQCLTILCQVFLTAKIATRFELKFLLTCVPFAMVVGLLVLANSNSFEILAIVFIARRVGEYSIVRPGREMLFSVIDTETKYKAKSLIDVPVYRAGDAMVANLSVAIKALGASPAIVGSLFAAFWVATGWWLGTKCLRLQQAQRG